MIVCQIDYRDIFEAFAPLAGRPFAHLLSGGAKASSSWGGEWQTIVAAPAETLLVRRGRVFRNGQDLGLVTAADPLAVLEDRLELRRTGSSPQSGAFEGLPLPPFLTGAFGHINYEIAALLEPVLALPVAGAAQPEMAFGFYDAVAVFHQRTEKAFILGSTGEAVTQLQDLLALPEPPAGKVAPPARGFKTSADREDYVKSVRTCQDHILAGDIFQANISRALEAHWPDQRLEEINLPAMLRQVQHASAASFGALLQYEESAIISNSPERFFSVWPEADHLNVVAEPVKGTRPRHPDPAEDRKIAASLVADEKDRAENIMIADLVRNDLSRVCRDHSIREEKICELQSFAHVHHLVSRISGTLQPGKMALDVLRASFPCGSITGAPKIRAMEIIAAIEKRARGVYCGAIGFMDDRGGAEFSVPIRTAQLFNTGEGLSLSFGAGGGITVLSDPEGEFEETIDKAATFHELAGTQPEVKAGG